MNRFALLLNVILLSSIVKIDRLTYLKALIIRVSILLHCCGMMHRHGVCARGAFQREAGT